MLKIYTDGSCIGNPGPGGWAWAVPNGRSNGGFDPNSTNQRMELTASYMAVKENFEEEKILIISDSNYVVKCFNDNWWRGWIKRNWKNAAGKAVANQDLWQPFIELYQDHGNIEFQWVKGHSGDEMNDLVDEHARQQVYQNT